MLSDLKFRLRAIFRRKTVEDELEREVRFHFEHQVEKFVKAGMSKEEAERRARLAMGGVEQLKEEVRDARGVSLFETSLQDLQYGFRMLRKSPGFTIVVALSLALGIGANTAIFTLIDTVMLRMVPVRDPEHLHFVTRIQGATTGYSFAYDEYRILQEQTQTFANIAVYSMLRVSVSLDGSIEPTAEAQLVSGDYLATLGVAAAAGRSIGHNDDLAPNAHPVAMISYGYWNRRFALAPSVIGRTISLCGKPFTIIGVTPDEFFGLEVGTAPDIFVPLMMQPAVMPAAENWLDNPMLYRTWLKAIVRIKPELNPDQAIAALAGLDLRHDASAEVKSAVNAKTPESEKLGLSSAAVGLSSLRQQFSQSLLILMIVVGVVLLIACANVANLLLARSAARVAEFSMRRALGAGRFRLMRQLLVESVLLAVLGGVSGLVLARWATQLLVAFMSSGRSPIVLDLQPDLRILAFTAAVSILTGILFGFAPALRAGRVDVMTGLKGQAGRATGGRHALRSGKILVVTQIALSLLLLAAAGLFVRTLQKLNGLDAGFDRENVVIVRVEPKGSDQRGVPGTSLRLDTIYRDLIARIESIPGVRSASMGQFSPTTPIGLTSPIKPPSGEEMRALTHSVYPHYFATMGLSIIAGRDFDERDLGEHKPEVAVVSETLARAAFGSENPVGRTYVYRTRFIEIIGVVKDSKYANLRTDTPAVVYLPFLQTNTGRGQMTLHVRTSGPSASVLPRIREEVQKLDRDLPLFELHTLAAEMDSLLIRERLIATLSGFFALLALILACIGLYGLMAFAVVRRTGEMSVRIAMGAARRNVMGMVMREALVLVLLGVLLGAPVAWAGGSLASKKMSGLLFGITATDPATIAGAGLVMILIATAAAYLPARRAARVDPMVALRNE